MEALAQGYDLMVSSSAPFNLIDQVSPSVSADRTEVGRNEEVKLTVSGIRANDLRVKVNGVEKGRMSFSTVNNRGVLPLIFSREGTYRVQVSVRLNLDTYMYGIWSNWSAPVTVTVSGQGDAPALILPDNLITIEQEAFAGIDSTYVVIPDGCTAIGDRAFADCPNLLAVTIPASVTSIMGNPFEGCAGSLVIITPAGSKADTFARQHGFSTER